MPPLDVCFDRSERKVEEKFLPLFGLLVGLDIDAPFDVFAARQGIFT